MEKGAQEMAFFMAFLAKKNLKLQKIFGQKNFTEKIFVEEIWEIFLLRVRETSKNAKCTAFTN